MSKEIFIALSGGMAYQRQLEMVANNLANVSTAGFKADRPVFQVAQPDFAAQGRNPPAPGTPANLLAHSYAALPTSFVDLSGGVVQQTGDLLNVALQSEGFFTVRAENGDELYTRDGDFRVDADGTLVTRGGLPVLGERGEIKITSPDVSIDARGTISVGNKMVDRLRIVRLEADAALEKVGDCFFTAAGANPTPLTDAEVVQGALEQSNVDPVRGMVELINVQRNFESFTRVVASMDDLEKKVNQRVKL